MCAVGQIMRANDVLADTSRQNNPDLGVGVSAEMIKKATEKLDGCFIGFCRKDKLQLGLILQWATDE